VPEGIGLAFREVSIGHGSIALLRNVSGALGARAFLGLLGVNGSGKSTFLRTLIGELPLIAGEIGFVLGTHEVATLTPAGLTIADSVRIRHAIEIVPYLARIGVRLVDATHIFNDLTAQQNLTLACSTLNSRRKQLPIEARLESDFPELHYLWLKFVGQGGTAVLSRKAGALSGGERQILSLLCGLITEPRLLLLDEPTLGLSRPIVDYLFALLADWKTLPRRPTIVIADQFSRLLGPVTDELWDIAALSTARIRMPEEETQ
jgi:branched-chain amino acid transport system ATP-binding protein